MLYKVECYENQRLFRGEPDEPVFIDANARAWVKASPMRLVASLTVEAPTPDDAVNVAFDIANAPWEPRDALGYAWPHNRVRSMSSGDVCVVRARGVEPGGFICESWGWGPIDVASLRLVA